MLDSQSPRRSRRALLAGAASGLIAPLLLAPKQTRANIWDVYASASWNEQFDLWSAAGGSGDWVATLDPGATLLVLDGPSYDGWYFVDPIELADVPPGWAPGWLIDFRQRARATENLTLLDLPGDWSSEIGTLRRGFTVTLIGPVLGDWVLVRSGERAGYASIWSLEPSEGPETDRNAEYWVDVSRSEGLVRLCVGDSVVDRFSASLSADQGEGFFATATGTYWIYQKIEELTYTPYADAYFKFWAGFDPERFNGFHSWTMDADGNLLDGGWGATSGCVATAPDDAWAIYHFVELGTRVHVHW